MVAQVCFKAKDLSPAPATPTPRSWAVEEQPSGEDMSGLLVPSQGRRGTRHRQMHPCLGWGRAGRGLIQAGTALGTQGSSAQAAERLCRHLAGGRGEGRGGEGDGGARGLGEAAALEAGGPQRGPRPQVRVRHPQDLTLTSSETPQLTPHWVLYLHHLIALNPQS